MCGRSASTVRREGGPNPIGPPYPYRVATVGTLRIAVVGPQVRLTQPRRTVMFTNGRCEAAGAQHAAKNEGRKRRGVIF